MPENGGKGQTMRSLAAGEGWLAMEKPAGMSVHNDPGRDLLATAHALVKNDRGLCRRLACPAEFSLQAVHRLDRDTSGVVLLACGRESLGNLARQFRNRQIRKRYIAVVHGRLSTGTPGKPGEWTRSLGRNAGGRRHPQGTGRPLASRTRYRLMGRSAHYSLVSCEPLTGRKHQIRRHALMGGHPVVGDRRYGSRRALRFVREELGFERLALHAWSLRFHAPAGTGIVTVRSPGLPVEILGLLAGDHPGPRLRQWLDSRSEPVVPEARLTRADGL